MTRGELTRARRPGNRKQRSTAATALRVLLVLSSLSPLACTRPRARDSQSFRNVLLISIDTCRPDYLSCYGYPKKTTPNIDAVAADGVLFTRAYSTNPMTLPAHSSMLTGTLPLYHGVHMNNNDRLAESNLTLAEVLRARGFETGAFVGAFVLDSIFGLSQGFDTYDDRFADPKNSGGILYNERSAEEVSRAAMAWLEQHHDSPFFLFLHYFDPHQPYEPPPPFDSAFPGAPYAGEIAYADHHIGLVIEKMKELGLYDSTLLIITSDHGQGLGDHGEETHAYFVYDSTIHVPLVFRMPGGVRGVRVDDPVSLIDIVPSILELAGLPRPEQIAGQSLAAGLRGQPLGRRSAPIYFESLQPMDLGCTPFRGIVDGRWKYVRARKPELYDMDADGENTNVVAHNAERARDLDRRLSVILASERPKGADSSLPVDASTRERLRALGYLAADEQPHPEESLSDPKGCFGAFEAFGKAQIDFEHNRFAEAEAACLAAIAERPMFLNAHSLLAGIALEQGKMSEAEQRYRRYLQVADEHQASSPQSSAIHLNYSMSRVRNNLGNALLALGRTDEAAAEYREALRLEPLFPEAHQNLGTALSALGRTDEAAAEYREALRLEPSFPEAHQNLGAALEASGDEAGAIEEYRAALRLKPDFVDAQKSLGQALSSAGQWDEAAAVLTAALRRDPGDPDAHLALGWAEQRRGNIAAALQQYNRALEIRPDEWGYNNLAWIYATYWDSSVRDAARAVQLATRAAELTNFRDPGILDTLGASYASAGRFEEAIKTMTRALELIKAAGDGEVAGLNERLLLFRRGEAYRQTPP